MDELDGQLPLFELSEDAYGGWEPYWRDDRFTYDADNEADATDFPTVELL